MRHTDKEFREILCNFYVDLLGNDYYSLLEFRILWITSGRDLKVSQICSLFKFIMNTYPAYENDPAIYKARSGREWIFRYLNQFFLIEGVGNDTFSIKIKDK